MSLSRSPDTFIRRNFVLCIINGALFNCAMSLIRSDTVLAFFILRLTDSRACVGLVSSLMTAGWMWPQLFLANVLEPRPRKKPFYVVSAIFRSLAFAGVVVSTVAIGDRDHALLFALVATFMFVFASCGGIGVLPFMDIVGKSIPPNRRGSLFGIRNFFGGLLGLGAGCLTRHILSPESGYAFPANYVILFTCALACLILSTSSWCFCVEPHRPTQKRRIGWVHHLRRGPRIFRRDRDFRRFALSRVLQGLTMIAGPYYATFARDRFDLPEQVAGTLVILFVGANIISNFLWARISDRFGNRKVLVIAALLNIAPASLAFISQVVPAFPVYLPTGTIVKANVAVFMAAFVVGGFVLSGGQIGAMNYLLELAPERRRTTYLGFMYALYAPLAFMPVLGGVIVEHCSYNLVFGLALLSAVSAILPTIWLTEPRHR